MRKTCCLLALLIVFSSFGNVVHAKVSGGKTKSIPSGLSVETPDKLIMFLKKPRTLALAIFQVEEKNLSYMGTIPLGDSAAGLSTMKWDETFNGKPLKSGLYIVSLEIVEPKSGNVTSSFLGPRAALEVDSEGNHFVVWEDHPAQEEADKADKK